MLEVFEDYGFCGKVGGRGRKSLCLSKSCSHQNNGNEHAEPGEPVSKARINRFVGSKIIGKISRGPHVRRKRLEEPAVGINRNGKAVIRGTHDPAAGFLCPPTAHLPSRLA